MLAKVGGFESSRRASMLAKVEGLNPVAEFLWGV